MMGTKSVILDSELTMTAQGAKQGRTAAARQAVIAIDKTLYCFTQLWTWRKGYKMKGTAERARGKASKPPKPPSSKTLRVVLVLRPAGTPTLAARRPRPTPTTTLSPPRRAIRRRITRLRGLGTRHRARTRRPTTTRTSGSGIKEIPRLPRRKLDPVRASRVRNMPSAVGNPGHCRTRAGVHRLDMVLLACRGLGGVLGGASVGLQPLVAELSAHGDGEHVVGCAVHAEVCHRGGAP